ncbi:MAG: CPBP family intramembrane metalloprotease [Bacteroidales bacterium]|nr:CPBP family intramembrane metalloprotease [Bacteroidales bacterium]
MKTNLFRKPITWIVIVAIAVVSAIYAFNNFDKANPIVSLDIKMNRETALEKAAFLAGESFLGPLDYKTAAVFTNDERFQNFVELEAGGLEKFTEVLETGLYSSYNWKVRHFMEHETNEVTFYFTPRGDIYGFFEKLADSEKGAALEEEDALKIAIEETQKHWNVNFAGYELVEESKEEVESGRIDHSFVYERHDKQIGEGRYRLRLMVSGDKLTQVKHFAKIPEEFDRRYTEMRSQNDLVATFGAVGLVVIYGLGGVIIGLFFLLRRRQIIWKPAVIWGSIIALGSVFLVSLNVIPLSWFSYDTSVSAGNFITNIIVGSLLGALGVGAMITITFMAAEGLGRMAFPHHVQLWRVWGSQAGGSLSLLGQTMTGYLFMVIMIGVDVLFYVVTKHFGWWSPAGNLSDPNILANYMPWFNSVAISLQAGFWEEALCRAVPLAGIVLLTRNSRHKKFWIILVLILQTFIFGAAHANYPQQPSYARVLEMVIPFVIMGLIYIGYGLIPAIIAHYAIDVFWISLPLWVASSPGIWFDRIMVIFLFFVPLWVVLYFRLKNKKWKKIPEELRNDAWKPAPKVEEVKEKIEISPEKKSLGKLLIPAGIAGLVLWLTFTPFTQDAPKLETSRSQAIEIASKVLVEKFGINPGEWTILCNMIEETTLQHKFVWQEGGEENYEKYLGSFLPPPRWSVRLVKTKGKVEERSEEYSAVIDVGGNVLRAYHKIPEKREGASLEQAQAQILIDSVLLNDLGQEREKLKEISITPKKLDNRKNWTFVYADTLNYTLEKGQGRYQIFIDGDEVVLVSSFVHIPEDWERNYNDQQSKRSIIRTIGKGSIIVIVIAAMVLGIIRWTRKRFSVRLFLYFTIGLFVLFFLDEFLSWDTLIAGYQTSLPMNNFITMMVVTMAIGGIFISAGLGIIGGMSVNLIPAGEAGKYYVLKATGLGLAVMGLFALFSELEVKNSPFWGEFLAANSKWPVISIGIAKIQKYILLTGFLLALYFGLHTLTKGWSKGRLLFGTLVVLLGVLIEAGSLENYSYWLISGGILGLILLGLYILFIRYHFEWIPLIAMVPVVLEILKTTLTCAIPAALAGGILGLIFIGALSWWWYSEFRKIIG